MTFRTPFQSFLSAACISGIVGCIGCETNYPSVSHNIDTLGEIIDIQFPVKSGQWETFSTPEAPGGALSAPADYITLVAELQPGSRWFDSNNQATGEVFIVSEAPRAWLASPFRKMLEKSKNSSVNLSSQADCRKYSTTLKKTRRQSSGFVCKASDRILMYLTISSAKQVVLPVPSKTPATPK